MSHKSYIHGYSKRESERLSDQAQTLTALLHDDTRYPPCSRVLEAGCGIGAQTVILAKNSPGAYFTLLDISEDSLQRAEFMIKNEGISNVSFLQGDIFHPPFEPETFDHIFVCFVLEHLAEPQRALERLRPLLKKGGTITVIEGDHGSAFFHPDSQYAQKAIDCLIHLQRDAGGNALIGRQLYPLLVDDQKAFVSHMREAGVACSKVHERNDTKMLFKRFETHLPGVDYFDTHQVNIPVGWWVSEEDREQIVNAIRSYDGNTNHTASRIKSLQEMY